MDFIHRPYIPGETISGISTPPGEGGISIIRISGKDALLVAQKIFSGNISSYASHTAHLGIIRDLDGNRLDEALLLIMRAPRSFTGEDTVEFHCHGGMIASKKVLEATLKAGARAALPGEFSFKAFMSGKIDLAQAEAIQKLISAKNEEAFAAANQQLEGALSKKIEELQKKMVHLAAILEAWVDFPEEGIEFATMEEICEELTQLKNEMQRLYDTFEDGRRLEQGISLCLVGAPNAGKSSLMNALLGHERAIVTPIAGTTRDLLHEEMTIGGLHFKLTDTAGMRKTQELIEKEGIRRTECFIKSADVLLLVLDASKTLKEEEKELFTSLPPEKTIAIWNKSDLAHHGLCDTPFPYAVKISAKFGTGLEELKKTINQMIWKKGAPAKNEVLITATRHKEALGSAIQSVTHVISGLLSQLSPEFLTADLRNALSELGRVRGLNVTEDLLTSIFSQFCIGK